MEAARKADEEAKAEAAQIAAEEAAAAEAARIKALMRRARRFATSCTRRS